MQISSRIQAQAHTSSRGAAAGVFRSTRIPPRSSNHLAAPGVQGHGASSCSRRVLLASAPIVHAARSRAVVAVMSAAGSKDLLIVGPGVLGSVVGKLWKEQFPAATVVAQTNTTNNHDRLKSLNLTPRTKDQDKGEKFPYVLFAAPPSGSEDYIAEVEAATDRWDGSGSFVFTSSMSVCATEDGSLVTEACPVVPAGKSPSTDRLLGAEQAVLAANGNVLRLVGLYHATRGPHTFFAKAGEVARYGGYTVNMLHYEDAAGLAAAILRGDGAGDGGSYKGRVFLGADNHPITFEDMMAACFGSGVMQGSVKFTGTPETGGGLGKQVNNDATRQQLGWEPKYSSFKDFFYAGAKDLYNSESFQGMGMAHKGS